MNQKLMRQCLQFLVAVLLVIFLVSRLSFSRYSDSFHDLNGGRLPLSDSAGWITGSVAAMQGRKQAWVTRRPLNVVFNAPVLLMTSSLNGDPLVNALRIKRTLAILSISWFLFAISRIVSLLSVLVAGLLLLSVLFSGTGGRLSMILGQSVGYTHGTELNGFIFVTAGVACLVPVFARIFVSRRVAFADILHAITGFLLVCISASMRPGPLFLVPLLAVGLGAGLLQTGLWSPSSRSALARNVFSIILIIVLSMSAASGLQTLAFNLITNDCGAIGGNQGYVVYGLSQGANWKLARGYLARRGIPMCERVINPMLVKQGRQSLFSNPAPFIRLLFANAKARVSFVTSNKYQLLLIVLALLPMALPGFRIRLMQLLTQERGLLSVLVLSFIGCLASDAFVLVFLGEGGLRPIIPYAVFPILLFAAVLDLYFRALSRRWCLTPALLWNASHEKSKIPSAGHFIFAPLMFSILACVLAVGFVLMAWQPLQASLRGGWKDRESPPVVGSYSISLGWSDWRLHALPESYQLKLGAGVSDVSSARCIHYRRDRLPDSMPIGDILAKASGCDDD